MRMKGRKAYVQGVDYTLDTAEFSSGDGECGTSGYIDKTDRTITIDKDHLDDATLAHELGHALADQAGVYLSEYQMTVFEIQFGMLRDPRNKWILDYFAGE